MPLPFNKSLDLKLLELVKDNPILYNSKHSKYLDFDSREVVWQKIGDTLSRPAAEFAGIQCQIQFGDYQEDKHKPGFIENLSEFLPSNYTNSWGIEKKLFKAHSKYRGLSPLEAKNAYIKTARELPTYGVTFFLVKEKQKGKMKLVPRLLGINAESILRLDENTKEIIQQWPLTHVKTYHVGKSDTFTLKFGDWSDKEYSCKTQDVLRIRDILVGYIDLIQRRMVAKPTADTSEAMIIYQDNIQSGQSNTIQHVKHQAVKPVQETFVGPTVVVPFQQGSSVQQGTQMMTVHQLIQTHQMNNPQNATVGLSIIQSGGVAEVTDRNGDIPIDCVRKLKRMNSNSVKIVGLLTDPTEEHVKEAQEKVNKMTADLVVVEMGVKETARQQTIEESKKMLLDEMQDLTKYMNQLASSTAPGHLDTTEAKDAAEKIADLTIKMTFAQDPRTKRRSELLNRSKKSFIAGEKMDATIRRASFLEAATTTLAGIDHAKHNLAHEYTGPHVDETHANRLEEAMQEKIGRLNAALALYLSAHSDPNNIDYPAAITSMHTINELMKSLPTDAQMLASTKDPEARKELLNDMQILFDGARMLCTLTEADERDKMQDVCNNYANVADKLIFTLSRGKNFDKENEIIELARNVGDKTTHLLKTTNELIGQSRTDPANTAVESARVRSAAAARDLLACAQLTAPAIHEPHCRSALSAANEGLTSSLHQLSAAWKPLVADPTKSYLGDELHHREMDVHKALEKLNDACNNISTNPEDESLAPQERQRLKFICSLSGAKKGLDGLQYKWDKPEAQSVDKTQEEAARSRLSQLLAQLNAAIAALSHATHDPDNSDYNTAESALQTISEITPQIIKDMEVMSRSQDEGTRNVMQQRIINLCEATKEMLANVDHLNGLGGSAGKFAAASSKLVFLISPEADKGKEKMMAKLSAEIYDNVSELASHVHPLMKSSDPEAAADLEHKVIKLDGAARGLVTVAQVTAPSIDDVRCASALSSAIQELQGSSNELTAALNSHLSPNTPEHQQVQQSHEKLQNNLDYLTQLCRLNQTGDSEEIEPSQQHRQRLKFVTSMSNAKNRIVTAEKHLKRPVACSMMTEEDAAALKTRLSEKMAQLNAAIGSLSLATHDHDNPDYVKAQHAADTIAELAPKIIQELRTLCGTKDLTTHNRMLEHMQQFCDATSALCDSAEYNQDLNYPISKLHDVSKKLNFCISPACGKNSKQEIIDLTAGSCVHASELLSQVQTLTREVGRDVGSELSQRAASTADAAENLLTVAQVTAASIESPQSLKSLESAIEALRLSADELTTKCTAHAQPDDKRKFTNTQQHLNDDLNKLLQACREAQNGVQGALPEKERKKQRLRFINSLSSARDCFDNAHKQLQQPVICALMKESDGEALQCRLSERVAQLNAAIAALALATSDREKPDYASAQQAVNTITTLMPQIVQETRVLSGTKDGATQDRLLQQLQHLCEASRAVCDNGEQPQGLREAAAKFSEASSKLMCSVSPDVDEKQKKQIIDLTAGSCVHASELLSQVQTLTREVGRDVGSELSQRAASTADAAENFLTVAQVTAPSISSPQCLKSLETAVEILRGSVEELTTKCTPHARPSDRQKMTNTQQHLNNSLDGLLQACREAQNGVHGALSAKQRENQRLQFINSLSGARNCFDNVHNQLEKPVICALMKESDGEALQCRLSERVAQLNAAIAALALATSDREKPDYASAQQAVNTITTLMPQIVQETRVLSGTKDDATQDRLLQQLQHLCEASRAVCDNGEQPQGLREAAAKFSEASSKLMCSVSPDVDEKQKKQIIDLTAGSCVHASELLSQVQTLTREVGRDVGSELSQRAASTADAAENLLTVAQVTAPSISSPQCLKSLETAVEILRGSVEELTTKCTPHARPSDRQKMTNTQQHLNNSLDGLLQACREAQNGVHGALSAKKRENQRLQFINSLSGARNCFDNVHNQLEKPVICALMKESDGEALQCRLSERVAQLNAAIAALALAISDREKPDYASAQQAVNTITTLMPQIVQETRVLSGTKDDATQDRLLQQLQHLCEASRAVCDNGEQPQGLREAAAKFSEASSKLMCSVSPDVDEKQKKQIIDLTAGSCVHASELLSQVQTLTREVGRDVGSELSQRAASTADAAENLLTVAQVTAPSISSLQCLKSLETAVETLRGSANELTAMCAPYARPAAGQQLSNSQQHINDSLDKLLKACREAQNGVEGALPGKTREKQRLQFINSLAGIKRCFDDAHARLEQPAVRELLRQEDGAVLEYQLSERVAQLNAAVAALSYSMHDRENPDYMSAQAAVTTITSLIPLLVQDAKSLSSTKEGDVQQRILHQVQQLCDVSRDLCEKAGEPQGLHETAAKFANVSGNVIYTISPGSDPGKEKQIVDLSVESCVRASELLLQVQELIQEVDGDVGTDLDIRGAKSADAAKALFEIAQVTAATIDSPHCQEALEKAVETLRNSAMELTAASAPQLTPGAKLRQLQDSHKALIDSLDLLLQACRDRQLGGGGGLLAPPEEAIQRVEFIRSVSAFTSQLENTEKHLKEPLVHTSLMSDTFDMLEHHLTARLAQLNAAIAALTSATTDHSNPDYSKAERAIITIAELMPIVVEDAKKMSCTKDANNQRLIQDNLNKLYESSRRICDNPNDLKKLNEAAANFAITSSELVSLVGAKDHAQYDTAVTNQASKAKGPKPAVPIRSANTAAHAVPSSNSVITKDFLDNLRAEESGVRVVAAEPKGSMKPLEEEQKQTSEKFLFAVDSAQGEIKYAQNLVKELDTKNKTAAPSIDAMEVVRKEKHMEEMLGMAGMQVVALVSANYANKLDYKAATEPIVTLTRTVRSAVEDGSAISGTLQEEARKKFINDMIELCEATDSICDTSKNDTEKLNDAAVIFSNQTGKLLRVVSANVNPTTEKEVMSRATAIGENTSRLVMEASTVYDSSNPNSPVSGSDRMEKLRTSGVNCLDAARKFVYTAKIIAPTIHESTCQDTLLSSADTLSANIASFEESWKPLATNPHTNKLIQDVKNLETLLEELKADINSGKFVERKNLNQRIILDTPLRQLTCQIIENAKNMTEYGDIPAEDKQEYKKYSSRLTEALRALDLANARCQRAPHDKNRRSDMYTAIGDLEVLALQSRPARAGQPMNNIVDFREFIEGMMTESVNLAKVADKYTTTAGKILTDDIKVMCTKISEEAPKLLNPAENLGYDTCDDIMEIDNFAQDCDLLAKEMISKIRGVPDQKTKAVLQMKLLPLIENINFLRFATNSALSTAQSASYDVALQDLDNFHSNVIQALVKRVNEKKPRVEMGDYYRSKLMDGGKAKLLKMARAEPQKLCRELTDCTIKTLPQQPDPSYFGSAMKNVMILSKALRELTEAKSIHAANGLRSYDYLSHDYPLQNITQVERSYNQNLEVQVLKEEDLDKLLSSQKNEIQGTRSQLDEQFQQLAGKLNVMSSSIMLSIKKPELAAKSLHSTAEVAIQLANSARSFQDETRPIQCKKIEDATQNMSFATYDLLKTSELLCQDPNHPGTRRKLMAAIRSLNDAINKLDRTIHPETKISRECTEHLRTLQLQNSMLQSTLQPVSASPYTHCLDTLQSQRDVLLKLNSDQKMSRDEFLQGMMFMTTAVANSSQCVAQVAYLLSVSEKDKNVAVEGLVDVSKMQQTTAAIHDSCVSIVINPDEQASEEKRVIAKLVDELIKDLDESIEKTKDQELKKVLRQSKEEVDLSAKTLYKAIDKNKPGDVIRDMTLNLDDDIRYVDDVLQNLALMPVVGQVSTETQARCDDIVKHATSLLSNTQELLKEIKLSPEQTDVFKWSSYPKRREVLVAFEELVKNIKLNGQNSKILDTAEDESEEKSYVQKQTDTAFRWLHKPMAKSDIKTNGQQATKNLIDVGKKMTEELSGDEKEDMRHLVEETEQLFKHCCKRYDQEQYSLLMERIRELQKAIERVAVTRVVEDFMDAEEPLADFDILADAQRDEKSRKFLLERKIAELLAQLAGVTRAARFIADAGNGGHTISTELKTCSEQTELLAPMLVKAAEERIHKPDDRAAVENYKALLAQYTESLSKIRKLCDQSVDPMDFVQAASETMQRMREESNRENDPMKCARTSAAITKLANRAIHVGLSSNTARRDPELVQALIAVQEKLSAAIPSPDLRASKIPDWKDTTAQILRTTDEVEQIIGGETIFKNQPDDNQPIYNEALNLHEVTRGWSSRDNEIVAVAKRMAVLMANLSSYMNTNKQREVLTTTKAIVAESHEVARLAKKLAHECSDHRIKTNLLQLCEKIPTISGQLKMLATVKASSLGQQGTREDQDAMAMLVDNAQSLMISTRDVVNGAISASVKIMSQRGPRIKWVRKTYY